MKRIAILLVISLGLLITSNCNKGKEPEETYTGNADKAGAEDSYAVDEEMVSNGSGDKERDEIYNPYEGEYKWYDVDSIIDIEKEWRMNFSGVLYEEPSVEASVLYEGFLEQVTIIDGISVVGYIDKEIPYGPRDKYLTWFKIKYKDIEGWTRREFLHMQVANTLGVSKESLYCVLFEKTYSPIRVGPSVNSSPVEYIGYEVDGFVVSPTIEKGKVADLTGRCDGWLNVSFWLWDEGWLQYDDSIISIYRLIYHQTLPNSDMFARLKVYKPIINSFNTILIEIDQWGRSGEVILNKPRIAISTGNTTYDCEANFLCYSGGVYMNENNAYYLVNIPEKILPIDITAITIYADEPLYQSGDERLAIEINPRYIWGEVEE